MSRAARRAGWGAAVAVPALLAVACFVLLALWRYAELPGRPWAYIALALGGLATVAAMLAGISRAKVTDDRSADE